MKTIGIITVGRSDYGIYRSVLCQIRKEADLNLHLIVAGMHLLKKYGLTVEEIKRDGFPIAETVSLLLEKDTPAGIAESSGAAVQAFAQCYTRFRPDILLLLGDRFEMHAAALAALPFKIPVAHIHGGELTLGATDNACRHSITMLSHLHFVATEVYQKRVLQLGEEPWRVHCTGAPALDCLENFEPLGLSALARKLVSPLKEKPILVTFHPVTLEYENTPWQIDQLLEALENFDYPIVFTGTNADTSNSVIWKKIQSFISSHPTAQLVTNFGPDFYFNMLANTKVMVGNSSSGLIEAPSFALPVVNIGTRQTGRVRAKNVIDVGYRTEEIAGGIQKALSPKFRDSLKGMKNPHGDGKASERIVKVLKDMDCGQRLIFKRFVDYANG